MNWINLSARFFLVNHRTKQSVWNLTQLCDTKTTSQKILKEETVIPEWRNTSSGWLKACAESLIFSLSAPVCRLATSQNGLFDSAGFSQISRSRWSDRLSSSSRLRFICDASCALLHMWLHFFHFSSSQKWTPAAWTSTPASGSKRQRLHILASSSSLPAQKDLNHSQALNPLWLAASLHPVRPCASQRRETRRQHLMLSLPPLQPNHYRPTSSFYTITTLQTLIPFSGQPAACFCCFCATYLPNINPIKRNNVNIDRWHHIECPQSFTTLHKEIWEMKVWPFWG